MAGKAKVAPVRSPGGFQLSEGDRQELVVSGRVNVGGRLLTRDEVAELLGDDQRGVPLDRLA